jgi:hypothetical protein
VAEPHVDQVEPRLPQKVKIYIYTYIWAFKNCICKWLPQDANIYIYMEAMKPSKILYGLGGATLPHESTMTCYCACSRPPLKKKKKIGYSLFLKQRIPKLQKKNKKNPKHTNKYPKKGDFACHCK